MRLPLVLIATTLAAACATTGAHAPTRVDRVLVMDESTFVHAALDEDDQVMIPAPVNVVWDALVASYAELGILPTMNDRVAGRYGNAGFTMPGSLKDAPPEAYFRCGSGLGGSFGRGGRYVANVTSSLAQVASGETAMRTHVGAIFRSDGGTSNSTMSCVTTGRFEAQLRKAVGLRIAGLVR
ncbi:MAG: hypothetical protein H0W68_02860 [Gemmatimonadaceae bacterium]|nr:hypothetical protein [Gemmatimonadaceae bacterium]